MRVVVWNCQRVGSPLTVPSLREVNNLSSPSMFFLSETKNRKNVIDRIARHLRLDHNVTVEAMNRAGGMALLWTKETQIVEVNTTAFTIEAKVEDNESRATWWFIGVYASCDQRFRKEQWRVLTDRSRLWGSRFLITGDFNDILSNDEKWEGAYREERSFRDFRDFIDCNRLVDIGFEDTNPGIGRKKKRFYFDKRWLHKEGIQEVVEQAWNKEEHGSKMFKVTRKIRNCRIELLKWRNKVQSNSRSKINDLKQELDRVRNSDSDKRNGEVRELKKQLAEAYKEEEIFWSQKARISWLREGDKNTKYFHSYVKGRRVSNNLSKIQREDGSWTNNEDEVVTEIAVYFKELFTSGGRGEMTEILSGIPHSITQEMNDNLIKEVSEKEIHEALFSMNPEKAPGHDGMTPLFFQNFWSSIKNDIIPAIKAFFHSSLMLKSVNHTVISLIPKTLHPINLKNYRPISLCSVIYKIISKILANRLKNVLDSCISKTQSAFIPDRQILDNVIISHEYMHYLKNKRQGKEGYMAIKLDMAKAYDRVEWHFLLAMMEQMGFCATWINWIHSCLKTVSYSFNYNGEVKGYVSPERGIRQGDPLSPYLFLICSEGFSNLLRRAEESKRIEGLKISRQGPVLTHLFFADDSIIFCKANKEVAGEIMKVLKVYENSSGQLVNLDKSAVFFSKNVVSEKKGEICQALGGMREATQGKYLGLPMVVSRTKEQIFGFVRDNIRKRFQNWKNRFLSPAGKEVLLKAVAMAMPTYIMSCFKLPRKLCKDVCALMANFWWGESNGKNKIHWISWERMAWEKKAGGLGFKDLEAFNQALLGKQMWRLITRPNLLVTKVLKAKYFPKEFILHCSPTKNASWFWQGLMGARSLLNEGLIRRIGNGRSTSIWEHKWIPDTTTGRPTTSRRNNCGLEKVEELICHQRWNRNIIFRNFNRDDAHKILAIPLGLSEREDSFYWQPKAGGQYTVNSGYNLLMKQNRKRKKGNPDGASSSYADGSPQVVQMWNTLWSLNIKHKIKFFIWKCIQGALPVKEAVRRRTGQGDPTCTTCGTAQETVEHLLLTCPHSMNIWKAAPIQWDGAKDHQGNFKRWWLRISEARLRPEGLEHIGLTANILWQVWKERNKREFEKSDIVTPFKTITRAHKDWMEQLQEEGTTVGKSTEETAPRQDMQDQNFTNEGVVIMEIETTKKKGQHTVGIGVTVKEYARNRMTRWLMNEISLGSKVLDDALALKLALCKAVHRNWSKVKLKFCNKELWRQIKQQSPADIKMATVLEDISKLQRLFCMCSFDLCRQEHMLVSKKLSEDALGVIVDEERLFPQCS
nr:uncharacterized protein LOC113719906 [Coffea arabica]